MEINEFLEMMDKRERVADGSEAMAFCGSMTQRAMKITAELKGTYHTPEEIDEIFSELPVSSIPHGLWEKYSSGRAGDDKCRRGYAGSGRNLYWRWNPYRPSCGPRYIES